MRTTWTRYLAIFSCVFAFFMDADAADWPQWLGPNRNGSSPETGLLTRWPKEGPRVLWKNAGGDGYSAVAIADGRAVTLVQHDDKEWCLALDAATGKKLWETELAAAYLNQYGNGPRATPTIDGNRVYAQAASGPLVCLDAASGRIDWSTDLLTRFNVKNLRWGLCASPLVEGDFVYVLPGAAGASVVALKKTTGEVVWKTGDAPAAYASPALVTADGQKQLVAFNAFGLIGYQADNGKELWRIPWKTEFDVNICTPLVLRDLMFVASGEHVGSTLFQFKRGKPEVVWESKGKKDQVMTTYWANAVHHNGYLYGLSGEFDKRIDLNCVDVKTGKLMWSRQDFGKGAITLADGHLWIATKAGDLVLVHANPKDYSEKARVPGFLGDNRTVPTIANGRLYLRDLQSIYCLNIAGK